MKITLEIYNSNHELKQGFLDNEKGNVLMRKTSEDFLFLATRGMMYEKGDYIRVTTSEENVFLCVKLDEALEETQIFLKGNTWIFAPPYKEEGAETATSLKGFSGDTHYLQVRCAKDFEVARYQNLAFNPHDQKDENTAYPHASANVETRNDVTFFAKNAIDGIFANDSHGSYPYQSWGINRQSDAAFTIDFGRKVKLNEIGITIRCDFPHDSYWTNVEVVFDEETTQTFSLEKRDTPQYFAISEVLCEKLTLKNLKKADDVSPFPALTQFEAFGVNEIFPI